jgi:Glycosyl hydrolase family 9
MWQFGDSGVSYALVTALAAHPDVFGKFDRDQADLPDSLDEARWGADFLVKMQNPGDGSMRGDVLQGPGRTWMSWKAPDVHTDNRIGTPDDPVIAAGTGNVPLAIAAWASLARVLDARGVANEYLRHAERLWQFLTASDSATANPLILIGALEMHRATGNDEYRGFARKSAEKLLAGQKPDGSLPGDSGDHGDVAAAALALYGLAYPDDPLRDRVVAAGRKWLDFCIARTANPFGLSRQGTEQPEASFFHPSVGLGVNFWILGRAWAALLVGRLVEDPRALAYATDQIDWVLGKNPLDLCMFEGHGGRNPPRYHHRYNMIPGHERGAVPGAIANGIVRDMGLADRPGFDMSLSGGRAPSFRTSEPWLVHNMFYLLAVSALAESDEGDRPTR